MKKLLFLLLIISAKMFAQPITNLEHFDKKKLQWGYYFGTNKMDFKYDYQILDYQNLETTHHIEVQTQKNFGFNVGLSGDVRLVEHLNLRFEPGLMTNKKVLHFNGFTEKRHSTREVHSTYIYMPILLKYSSERWYNVKPFITGGASYSINLSSGQNLNLDNSEMRFRTKKHVFFYELGVGIDFYTPYFRFSPSIRGFFSINDELVPDKDPQSPWTSNLGSVKTRGFMIVLTFE